MATTGTATLDFGATPNDAATVLVTGLSGLTAGSHKEAFVQGDDTTADNTTGDHKFLSLSGRFNCEYVSATTMNVNCELIMGLATGLFTAHWVTA